MSNKVGAFTSVESMDLYSLVSFKVIPIVFGLCVATFYRPKSVYIPSGMLMLSIAIFWFTG